MFRTIAEAADLATEAIAVLVLAVGAIEAVVGLVRSAPRWGDIRAKKLVWVRFATSIVLALEFTLAGDIIRTAIAPSWNDIGQLGAIAAIRTALNWFLERDIKEFQTEQPAPQSAASSGPA